MERGRAATASAPPCRRPALRTWPQSRGSGAPRPRSRSGRRSRDHSPQHGAVRVERERDDRCGGGNEEQEHRRSSEPEHRRYGSGDRTGTGSTRTERRTPVTGRELAAMSGTRRTCGSSTQRGGSTTRREHRQGTEGSGDQSESKPKEKAAVNKERPSFELSGALLEDTNTFPGVVIKYSEPPEARIPKRRWRLYPFKNKELLPVMHIHRQSAYLLGRHRCIADIPMDHPSCSRQHAVFQYRLVESTRADGTVGRRVRPYIIDLGSGNGTFLNNQRIEPQRYYELKEKDVLRFGFSSREYVLLHESSDKSEANIKDDDEDEEKEEDLTDSSPRLVPARVVRPAMVTPASSSACWETEGTR